MQDSDSDASSGSEEEEEAEEQYGTSRQGRRVLLRYVLGSLTAVFTYNRVDSLLAKNYEEHVNALVALFAEDEEGDDILSDLSDCLAQLAQSTQDDTQWKYLNYQVLLCLRSPRAEVRRIPIFRRILGFFIYKICWKSAAMQTLGLFHVIFLIFQVRRCVLGVVRRFVESRGESYLAVLPDAVPFLCEVMEDEEDDLEAECKALLKRMEEVFGQSIESFFE